MPAAHLRLTLLVAGSLLVTAAVRLAAALVVPPPDPAPPVAVQLSEPVMRLGAPPVLYPEAVKWIRRLDRSERTIAWTGDDLVRPTEAVALLRLGRVAVPTILYEIEHTQISWTRDLLIEIAGRTGDLRARPVLERMLDHPD